jgi:hypothetical protein
MGTLMPGRGHTSQRGFMLGSPGPQSRVSDSDSGSTGTRARVSGLDAAALAARPAKAVPVGAFSSPWAANLKFCDEGHKNDLHTGLLGRIFFQRLAILLFFHALSSTRLSPCPFEIFKGGSYEPWVQLA